MSENPTPSQASIIALLNHRLDQKAQEIRRLENAEIQLAATCTDLQAENAALRARLDANPADEPVPDPVED